MMRALLAALVTPLLTLATPAAPVAADSRALPAPEAGAEVFLRPADGVFDVVGGGFGHGHGMSQYGADGAAKKGLSHGEILAHYYPGSRLVTRPDVTVSVLSLIHI